MSTSKQSRGFTLIELLVTIAIIGLLSVIAITALNTSRTRARDAKRVADIRTLQKGLALYFSTNNSYPTAAAATCLTNADAVSVLLKASAMQSVPFDPLSTCKTGTTCCYQYTSANGSTYTLRYTLEGGSSLGAAGNYTVGPI